MNLRTKAFQLTIFSNRPLNCFHAHCEYDISSFGEHTLSENKQLLKKQNYTNANTNIPNHKFTKTFDQSLQNYNYLVC